MALHWPLQLCMLACSGSAAIFVSADGLGFKVKGLGLKGGVSVAAGAPIYILIEQNPYHGAFKKGSLLLEKAPMYRDTDASRLAWSAYYHGCCVILLLFLLIGARRAFAFLQACLNYSVARQPHRDSTTFA